MPAPNADLDKLTPGLDSPAFGAVAVTPDNVVILTPALRALYVGVGGDLKVTTVQGNTVEFRNLPSGFVLPVAVKTVFASGQTGTIASAIVGLL